jgi:hypothetical protein
LAQKQIEAGQSGSRRRADDLSELSSEGSEESAAVAYASTALEENEYRNPFPKSKKYLIQLSREQLIRELDERIRRKKEEDPEGFEVQSRVNSLLHILKPKKGFGITLPCHFKMKSFRFLLKIFGVSEYDTLDFELDNFKAHCEHEFEEDKDLQFESQIFAWIEAFKQEILANKRAAKIRSQNEDED